MCLLSGCENSSKAHQSSVSVSEKSLYVKGHDDGVSWVKSCDAELSWAQIESIMNDVLSVKDAPYDWKRGFRDGVETQRYSHANRRQALESSSESTPISTPTSQFSHSIALFRGDENAVKDPFVTEAEAPIDRVNLNVFDLATTEPKSVLVEWIVVDYPGQNPRRFLRSENVMIEPGGSYSFQLNGGKAGIIPASYVAEISMGGRIVEKVPFRVTKAQNKRGKQ